MEPEKKSKQKTPYLNYVLVVSLMIIIIGGVMFAMRYGTTVDVVPIKKDPDLMEKFARVGSDVYHYFWKEAKPKIIEPPTYMQRLKNYLMSINY